MVKKPVKLTKWDLVKLQGRDIARRAYKTFMQTFSAGLTGIVAVINIGDIQVGDYAAIKAAGASLLLGSLGAAISAGWNSLATIFDKEL